MDKKPFWGDSDFDGFRPSYSITRYGAIARLHARARLPPPTFRRVLDCAMSSAAFEFIQPHHFKLAATSIGDFESDELQERTAVESTAAAISATHDNPEVTRMHMSRTWTKRLIQEACRLACGAAFVASIATHLYAAGLEMPLETLILKFEDNQLIEMPSVISGHIHVRTATGPVVIDDLPGVVKLEHGIRVARGAPAVEGPYRVTMIAAEYQKLQFPPTVSITLVEYIAPDDREGGVAGENVKTWFPPENKHETFCSLQQNYWHYKAAVTHSDTIADDICDTPRNWLEYDRDADMPQAWGITRGSSEVLVAVLDTGFDWKHPEFGAEFPPTPVSVEDSLYYFSSGVFYTNPNDPKGDATFAQGDSIPVPGFYHYDDDGDGFEDEDSLGRNWFNDAETDVVLGEVDNVAGKTIYDFSMNWAQGSLVDRWLYLDGGDVLGTKVRIQSNTAVSVTTDSIWIPYPEPEGTVIDDWSGWFSSNPVYRIGDGANNNEQTADLWIDDEGWLNDLPNDDDENGSEDDVHGADFNAFSRPPLHPCENEDYYDYDNNVFTLGSHGSGMATQIATVLADGVLMGAAPNVKILPVRVGSHTWHNPSNRCDSPGVSTLAMASGINYAATFHPDIIVTAMNQTDRGPVLTGAIQAAVDSGAVFINGAGNGWYTTEHWLDEVDPVVLVAGTDQWDRVWYDNVGHSTHGPFVTISARAAALRIAVPWGNGYDTQSGTSFAGPIVAGITALVKSAYPHMERDDLIWMITRGVDPVQAEGDTLGWMGSGRANAYRALSLYGNVAVGADTTWTHDLWVGGDVLVPDMKKLTVAPGTTVNVAIDDLLKTGTSPTDVEFAIEGDLVIQGEPGNPVTFRLWDNDGNTFMEYTTHTTVTGSTFTMDSLPAQYAEVAHYPIAAGSTDGTTVFTVKVTSAAAVDSVKVDTAGLGVVGSQALHDDGLGDDSAAGDGVYTSGRFQAGVAEGNHVVSVTSWTTGGAISTQDVTVEAVTNKAKFIDVSASTGDLYSVAPTDSASLPYSAIYFRDSPNSGASEDYLIVTIDDASSAPLFLRRTNVQEGAPLYQSSALQSLDSPIPTGARGVTFADFDGDGDNDFLVCGIDSAALYENRLDETEDVFVNVTSSAFGQAGALAGSVAASWGDYNRDGFVDLFVATTDYSGSIRDLNSPASHQFETLVYRNTGHGTFVSTPFGSSGAGNVFLTGCWVDLDGDDEPELVTAGMAGEYPVVYDNLGYSIPDGDSQLLTGVWATTGVSSGVGSMSVIDYNHDAYPDLLVTENAAPGRAVILVNNFNGAPASKSFTEVELAPGGGWSGAVVADFDLNGQEDYLLLPKSGEAALYMSDSYSTSPQYRDLAFTLGLRAGAVSGAIAGDFNNDHDPDLYLGRLQSGQFQYKNVRQDIAGNDEPDTEQKWVEVRLETTGSSDGGLIGTEVSVYASGQRWTQVVDGGSGRGGQRTSDLLFGLGGISESEVGVKVRYRSGEVDSMAVTVNGSHTFIENESVALKAGTRQDPEPDFEFELAPGHTNWGFKWRSTNVRGDLRRDVVHVENNIGYSQADPCYVGIDPGSPIDLEWGDPNVGHRAYWDGTYWQHEVWWSYVTCYQGCSHRFSVTSSSGDGSSATSGLILTDPTPVCLPNIED